MSGIFIEPQGSFLFGVIPMPQRLKKPCAQPGCPILTHERYCPQHKKAESKRYNRQRGTAAQRGYDGRWQRYTKWFLRQPGNQICKLRLDGGCKLVAQCVDHIDPPSGPKDPKFWDPANHQSACIHCNSVKGRRKIEGSDWRI